jgi:hypothetical protein
MKIKILSGSKSASEVYSYDYVRTAVVVLALDLPLHSKRRGTLVFLQKSGSKVRMRGAQPILRQPDLQGRISLVAMPSSEELPA